jgi:hypothetical protein
LGVWDARPGSAQRSSMGVGAVRRIRAAPTQQPDIRHTSPGRRQCRPNRVHGFTYHAARVDHQQLRQSGPFGHFRRSTSPIWAVRRLLNCAEQGGELRRRDLPMQFVRFYAEVLRPRFRFMPFLSQIRIAIVDVTFPLKQLQFAAGSIQRAHDSAGDAKATSRTQREPILIPAWHVDGRTMPSATSRPHLPPTPTHSPMGMPDGTLIPCRPSSRFGYD